MVDNVNIEHEHVFKTMYDETKHWEECKVCGKKQNEKAHSYTTTWALGYESCELVNSYTKVCTCGHTQTGHKPCVWDGITYDYIAPVPCHWQKCSICKYVISDSYYIGTFGNGKIYYVDKNNNEPIYNEYPQMKNCYKSDGTRIRCSNSGVCITCKQNIANPKHRLYENNNRIYCRYCQKDFGTISSQVVGNNEAPSTYTIITNVNFTNGATFSQTGTYFDKNSILKTNTQSVSNLNSGKTSFTITSKLTFNSSVKKEYSSGLVRILIKIDGYDTDLETKRFQLYPDLVKPTIQTITNQNIEGWSKIKPITITGTENYCDTVKLEIKDDKKKIIYTGSGNVTNGKYTISCTPDIESDENGKKFTAIVTDNCNNSTSKEFTISKIDAIPPEATSETKVEGEWSKSKNFTFKATDEGIGNVSIAFNNIEDLQLANFDGNEYSREYEFTGDVYSSKELSVLYKDELGNTSMQKITVDKLDNTAPIITNVSIHNNKLSITANDIKEGIGEGSGVSKYKYITSTGKIENPEIPDTAIQVKSNENIIVENISQAKYIYIVAEDLVGNISEVYEFKVPELILTSKVNLNIAEGKGRIELDWSSYDIADKYFVIYRKQENANEWEIIVPIEQKLTGVKYTDALANDKTNPSTPIINIEGKQENNNIEITQTATDTGTRYQYYIESYDSTNNVLISKSNLSK